MGAKTLNPEMNVRVIREGEVQVRLAGNWGTGFTLPSSDSLVAEMEMGSPVRRMTYHTQGLSA